MRNLCATVLTVLFAFTSAYSALVAHWDFSDQTYNDQIGSLNGSAVGTVSIVPSGNYRFDYALQTTASANNANYLNIGNIGSLGIYTNSFTLSYWFKASQATVDAGSGEVWESYSGNSSVGYEGIQSVLRKTSQSSAGKLYSVVAENGTTSTALLNNGVLADDNWHWIVIRYDGATDELKYFEDGVHIAYRDQTRIASLATEAARDARLGDGFGGLIADVRIYDAALSFTTDANSVVTGGELSEFYSGLPAALVAHWNFDGESYEDRVGSNDGQPLGACSIVPSGNGYFTNAVQTGSTRNSDVFNVGTLANLNLSTNGFTLSYWIKHDPFVNAAGFVDVFESNAQSMGMRTTLRASNISSPNRAYTSIEGLDGADELLNGGTMADGEWHWVVIRYDGETDTAHYFEDGHFYDTEVGIFTLTDGARKVYIGNGFDGLIGDIRIYNGPLSYTLNDSNDIVGGELDAINVPVTDDVDDDGIPNTWEELYFGNLTGAVPGDDPDADGHNNEAEYIAGSDPTDPASYFAAYFKADSSLEWNAVSGRVYSIYWSSDLISGFQCLESNVVWTGSNFVDAAHSADSQGFYRVDVRFE
ncbi:LamG-like jellyroll fold domain-containing protein [Tichowtungia aerotolerans]|uniref:LamG domain-containing protein n=1 Tax=Tichowtungia aerotolerans TaxID=2697043 RepID=A0A6P1MEA3_9BACT|nr:LamG-like jellyroll fold domain-containing protein [Tichowtungia aerotolerans]QHI69415.1 hypothetical protein GT409_08095 [Tichowtungia aerotolerans]